MLIVEYFFVTTETAVQNYIPVTSVDIIPLAIACQASASLSVEEPDEEEIPVGATKLERSFCLRFSFSRVLAICPSSFAIIFLHSVFMFSYELFLPLQL